MTRPPGGIDSPVLTPLSLAVGLFVALPALFGAAIAAVVDWLSAKGEHSDSSRSYVMFRP